MLRMRKWSSENLVRFTQLVRQSADLNSNLPDIPAPALKLCCTLHSSDGLSSSFYQESWPMTSSPEPSWPLHFRTLTSAKSLFEWGKCKTHAFYYPWGSWGEMCVIDNFSLANYQAYSWTSSTQWYDLNAQVSPPPVCSIISSFKSKKKSTTRALRRHDQYENVGGFSQSGSRMSQQGDVDDRRTDCDLQTLKELKWQEWEKQPPTL